MDNRGAMAVGRPLVVEWAAEDTADALAARYRREREARQARRWQAFWLVRSGRSMREAAAVVGVEERTVGVWLRWYRAGGLAAVQRRRSRRRGKKWARRRAACGRDRACPRGEVGG